MTGTINPELPSGGEPRGTADSKLKGSLITLRDALNGLLNSENKVTKAASESGLHSKVIATEQSREGASFATLSTPDEITGIVVPENAKLRISYVAKVKNSVNNAGEISVFLGANQIVRADAGSIESGLVGINFNEVHSSDVGLVRAEATSAFVTTGQLIGNGGAGGSMEVFAAPNTYTVSVQFKASSGSITAKERKLWVEVLS